MHSFISWRSLASHPITDTHWTLDEVEEAVEKSRAALLNLSPYQPNKRTTKPTKFTLADQMKSVSRCLSNSINSLRSEFKKVIDIVDSPFDVDARNKDSVKPVAEHIFIVAKEVLQGIDLYDICRQVSKNLLNYSKSTNERIITWEEFNKICNNDDKAKLNAIAMSLNESGHIIYVSGFKHIVLDPNWFCNEIIGSLIGFPTSRASKGIIGFDKGCIPRHFLEQEFESFAKSNVKGSLLVHIMEAMHLCCRVPAISHLYPSHIAKCGCPTTPMVSNG